MRRLIRLVILLGVCVGWAASAGPAAAQKDTPAAKATRKRLKTKISIELKDTPIKAVIEDIQREMDDRIRIKIDNTSGISNNSKITVIAKDQPLEKILNDLCDTNFMGYYVVSDTKSRYDGWIILRKSKYKERGYEGKEDGKGKEKSSLDGRGPVRAGGVRLPAEVTAAPRAAGPVLLAGRPRAAR